MPALLRWHSQSEETSAYIQAAVTSAWQLHARCSVGTRNDEVLPMMAQPRMTDVDLEARPQQVSLDANLMLQSLMMTQKQVLSPSQSQTSLRRLIATL
eukprot:1177754-Amphidinium_carterae.1